MLPGLRFLALATVMATSVLIFGLGAAALLLASHDRFSVMASRNLPHAPLLMARPVVERPVLSLLRVEPPLSRAPTDMVLPETPVEEARPEAAEVVVLPPPQESEALIVASVPPVPAQDTLTREDVLSAPVMPMGPLVTSPGWMEEERGLAVVSEFSPQPGPDVQAHADIPDAAPAAAPAVVASAGGAVPPTAASDVSVTESHKADDVVEETMVALIENPPLPRSRPDFDLLERQRQEAARRARLAEQRQRAAKLAANRAASRQAEAMRAQAARNAASPFGAPAGFGQGNAGGFGQFPQQQVAPPR